ncbi:MAG: TatD family hydrolase [Spirochaetales bacterium]|uniref:TatD family hydrolase n=1 Tax=Candidatus Thalassospirochaeta sargassi TaxID=3119039 RepID=A0AAJ1ID31_9SPIO|nr:TatD family hydrolase [Spirochaetales bacterium]
MTQPQYIDAHLHISPGAELSVDSRIKTVFLNSVSSDDFITVDNNSSPSVMPYFGIHPWRVENSSQAELRVLEQQLATSPICGIGECGLDFSKKYKPGRTHQTNVFSAQLQLAKTLNKPLSIHCVQAWGEMLNLLKRYSPLPSPFLLHSFYGSIEVLRQLLELGAYISLSELSLQNCEKTAAVIREIPFERILVETDLLAGSEDFSLKNHFKILRNNYKTIAELSPLSEEELIFGVLENGKVFTN